MVDVKHTSNVSELAQEPAAKETAALAKEPSARERYDSDELFGGRKEILIVHKDEIYRLRRTRHDKLILYK